MSENVPAIAATDLDGFNTAMAGDDRPWRLAETEPSGWVLIDDLTNADLLDLRCAQTEREAMLRAIAWLRSNGRI